MSLKNKNVDLLLFEYIKKIVSHDQKSTTSTI